ncbi:MAG TPA: cupin domain-containing protein [Methyloceanibacter sp.]|nr:cupin domain-containing protein [Methyloceanibacter sp.]
MSVKGGSLLAGLPSQISAEEAVETLCQEPGARIERIVSTGQTTPDGKWYDQEADEWVLLVKGGARLRIEGESQDRTLAPGDYLLLPAHCRHRVTWTEREPPTVWLAIHFAPD